MPAEAAPNARAPLTGRVWRHLFGLSLEEASFARRGFRYGEHQAAKRLERIGRTFLQGYHAALEEADFDALTARLDETAAEYRGFAYEGAAMGMTLLDRLTIWKRDRWRSFVKSYGSPHVYMMHVGVGWALARLRLKIVPQLNQLDPLLRWLAVDGYGFHEGYFNWRRFVEDQSIPSHLRGYAGRVFDQGLGRSIWFVHGAAVGVISKSIAAFHQTRQPDLWSGIGLACAYAGGVGAAAIEYLRGAAGLHRAQLAQGAAFAAKTRQRAANPAPHTELACRILCGLSAYEAAEVTDVCLEGLPANGEVQSYEIWRQRIQVTISGRS